MAQNTRNRIIQYLNKNYSGNAEEISKALSMTRANVQYHLQNLADDKIIEIIKSDNLSRGRPTNQYCLAVHEHENNYENLARAILLFLKNSANQENLYRSILVNMYPELPQLGQDIVSRLNQSVQLLNKHHYEARWEAHKDGPRIFFNNCPYFSILIDVPDICNFDMEMMRYLFRSKISLLKKINTHRHPPGSCVFCLGEAENYQKIG